MTAIPDAAAPSPQGRFHAAARPCHGRKCPDARPGPRKKFSKIEKQFPQGRGETAKIFKNRKTIPVLHRRQLNIWHNGPVHRGRLFSAVFRYN
ncbi:MAG: hypothetical protein ACAH83_14365 [Alphaproteobacteria bacterium]